MALPTSSWSRRSSPSGTTAGSLPAARAAEDASFQSAATSSTTFSHAVAAVSRGGSREVEVNARQHPVLAGGDRQSRAGRLEEQGQALHPAFQDYRGKPPPGEQFVLL
jgi:hypothetical protein